MKNLFHILKDGGIGISYIILLALLVILILFIRNLIVGKSSEKTIKLISSIGWFAVAWGFFGRTLGLIKAFDTIQASGELTPRMVSGGLKMALVGPLVGVIVFIIARLIMIILIARNKKSQDT